MTSGWVSTSPLVTIANMSMYAASNHYYGIHVNQEQSETFLSGGGRCKYRAFGNLCYTSHYFKASSLCASESPTMPLTRNMYTKAFFCSPVIIYLA
eukprot:scaffold286804_cov23-Prasinocladus_malaysianus.AAC.1